MDKITAAQECIEALNRRSASRFLLALLCVDLAFVVLHCINALTPTWGNPLLGLETDQGYPEMFQYLKFLCIIIILIHVSLRSASLHYVAWVSVFSYFLLDDSLQVHERAGRHIAAILNFVPPLGLRLQDYGELVVSAAAGIILLPPLVWAYKKGSRTFRKVSQDFALLTFILIFFGVVVDTAHIAIILGGKVNFVIGVIEDGGEMVSVSLILWYAFLMTVRDSDSARPTFGRVPAKLQS